MQSKPAGLSACRDLVERLDAPLVFEYLLQNGVICGETAADIRSEPTSAKVNLALLRHLEESRVCGARGLFVNALRQTGQHQLASLVDDGVRLRGSTNSDYLSKTRLKGQVCLLINVQAMKFAHDSDFTKVLLPETAEWISFDDIKCRIDALSDRLPQVHGEHIEDVSKNRRAKSWSCCLCSCFSWTRKRDTKSRKAKNGHPEHSSGKYIYEPSTDKQHANIQMAVIATPKNGKVAACKGFPEQLTSVATLRRLTDCLQQKATVVCETVADTSSDVFTGLVKYFEQTRSTLVLNVDRRDTDDCPGVAVVNICMQTSHIVNLERDYNSGALQRDLEDIIVSSGLLSKISATDVRLQTMISREELDTAEQELAT
ncbi:hypothetical protein LSAT2_032989 [Lamellibrachia satsuma]|nr:hypothetical protein LSAT2_032989 [Lamellibrachia satsuma]